MSPVVRELARVTKAGGYVLLGEPTISMGDWRRPRLRLTRHERGIPLELFRQIVADSGMEVIRQRRFVFSITSRLRWFLPGSPYNSRLAMGFDRTMCWWFARRNTYHATSWAQKIQPTSVAFVLRKPTTAASGGAVERSGPPRQTQVFRAA